MVNAEKLDSLLTGTKVLIQHQRELKKHRGETFNVFSILKMEHRENETHSAFLAELLKPKGSHLKGNIFLKLFLETLDENLLTHIDLETANVKVEHPVGKRDINTKTGGRIDIYIWDAIGNCISIENKIHAGDQEAQVERYCNHRSTQNKVYYLTLKGAEPSVFSKGNLQNHKDFFTISYRNEILEWLNKCIKESAEQPILRESIKQYKLLIQKLTSTMDKTQELQLTELMLKHYKEAEYITANFVKVSSAIKERVRQSVIKKLQVILEDKFIVEPGSTADKWFSQIWFKMKGFEKNNLFFGLESFSGNGNYNGDLFIGVYYSGKDTSGYAQGNDSLSKCWINTHLIPEFDGAKMNLRNSETLQKLHSNETFRNGLVDHIVNEACNYLKEEEIKVRAFLQQQNNG